MITWDFYSKRKGISLEKYLTSVETYEDAIKLFRSREIHPPSDLKQYFLDASERKGSNKALESSSSAPPKNSSGKRSSTARKKSSPKSATRKAPSRRKAPPKKKEEPVQEASQEQTIETKDEKKQYFRKIIKPEKK